MADDDWVMGALAAQDNYQPVEKPWIKYDVAQLQNDDLDRMPFGVGSPAESAHAPSGLDQLVRGAYTGLGETAKGAFTESERLRSGDGYNARPAVEAALMTMGGPLVGGTRAAAEGGVALGSGPIKAYHSSPHTFDKFDTSRIGTGEGAQVYGHGLYFAENPAVSGQGGEYWNQFTTRFDPTERYAAELLQKNNFDRDKALLQARKEARLPESRGDDPFKGFYEPPDYAQVRKILESDKPVGPRTYEVDIKADPNHLLDWDKTLHQQPEYVQKALERYGIVADKEGLKRFDDALLEQLNSKSAVRGLPKQPPNPTGEEIYRSRQLTGGSGNRASGTYALENVGVPGIRYLDEGSRKITDLQRIIDQSVSQPRIELAKRELAQINPTSNYVVFDPNIIDIRKMYGIGGIGAGVGAAYGMGDIAAQGKYQQQL